MKLNFDAQILFKYYPFLQYFPLFYDKTTGEHQILLKSLMNTAQKKKISINGFFKSVNTPAGADCRFFQFVMIGLQRF